MSYGDALRARRPPTGDAVKQVECQEVITQEIMTHSNKVSLLFISQQALFDWLTS